MSMEAVPESRRADEAQQRIRQWLGEIAALAEEPLAPEEFYAGCLQRLLSCLGAHSAALWRLDEQGQLVTEAALASPDSAALAQQLTKRRRNMAAIALKQREPLMAPSDNAALLIAAPIVVGGQPVMALEVVQRGDTLPAAQAGFVRFVADCAALIVGYLRNRQIRLLIERERFARQLAELAAALQADLEPQAVAYTLANEARRTLQCDRASVAICRASDCRLVASSGEESCDQRSASVRALARLAQICVRAGESLWSDDTSAERAPEVEAALDSALDVTEARRLAVVPLRSVTLADLAGVTGTASSGDSAKLDTAALHSLSTDSSRHPNANSGPIVGALILEQFDDSPWSSDARAAAAGVARLGAAALYNALTVTRVPFWRFWKMLGPGSLAGGGRSARLLASGAAVLAVVGLLALVPYPLDVHCSGVLQPIERRHLFAPSSGTVAQVLVKHGQQVRAGELLVELRNTDLEVAITEVGGQQAAIEEQILSIDRALFDEGKRMTADERNRLSSQRAELRGRLENLARQARLLQLQQEDLKLISPIDGVVTTWNVEELLTQRPVVEGQALLSLANTEQAWQLELKLPEQRIGHLTEYQAARPAEPIEITYQLLSDPSRNLQTRLGNVQVNAEVQPNVGNCVIATAPVERGELQHSLRPGAEVTAKLHCGQRSLGYVWLHDVAAFLRARVLFKL